MMPRLKVSGITRLHDARYCAAIGIHYLGFDQDPESPRYVPPAQAREIVEWVVGPEPVGLFVAAPPSDILEACRAAGFRLAQLSHATPEECAAVEAGGIPVIRTFEVRHDASSEQLAALMTPFAGAVRFVRLDTNETNLWGAAGASLNWRVVRDLAHEFDLFLAGDVTSENAGEARRMAPYAVDFTASVEESPGALDFDRLGAVIDALHEE